MDAPEWWLFVSVLAGALAMALVFVPLFAGLP